jgi:hypothetical protein
MLDQYGICSLCTDFLEYKHGKWVDTEGRTTGTVADFVTNDPTIHIHVPYTADNYESRKYSSLEAEIFHVLGCLGYHDDWIGDAATFGYYEMFMDYRAITHESDMGFISVKIFDSADEFNAAWDEIFDAYSNYSELDDFDEWEDDYPEQYESSSMIDESDLWDEF